MCEPAAIFSLLISSFACTPWDCAGCAVLSASIGDSKAAAGEKGNDYRYRQKNTVIMIRDQDGFHREPEIQGIG